MARFDLADYETVEERIKRFYEAYPDGRIKTKMIDAYEGDKPKTWVFKAYVYLNADDQANNLPKATGYASEKEGGPQSDWKAELGETSAIGRALANMGMSGNKRASREEMQKVLKADEAQQVLGATRDWLAEAQAMTDVDKLRAHYLQAKAAGEPTHVLKEIEKLAKK